jgi:hypothetical protein
MSTTVFDHHGKRLILQESSKQGGEGAIHLIQGVADQCAKIYRPAKATPRQYRKIVAMVKNRPHDPTWRKSKHRSIAWPTDVLFADAGRTRFAGFTMPLIDLRTFGTADTYYCKSDRDKRFQGRFTWKHLLTVAHNLASAVAAIHERGHRVGDLREANILVAPQALITLVDCDSFQVVDRRSGAVFHCRVGTAEYLPPELMSMDFRRHDVDRYGSDLFALGILVFQFLMNGFHPYAARGRLVEACHSTREKILRGHFAYPGRIRGVQAPAAAPSYGIVPPSLRHLMDLCFGAGHSNPAQRPAAADWFRTLRQEWDRLRDCRRNPNHWYGGHLEACPWCQEWDKTGTDPFANAGDQISLPIVGASRSASGPGRLVLSSPSVDLGTLPPGKPAEFEVRLTNAGGSPVEVTVQLEAGSCLTSRGVRFRVDGGQTCSVPFTARVSDTVPDGTTAREVVRFAVSCGPPPPPLEVRFVISEASRLDLAYVLTVAVSAPLVFLSAMAGLSRPDTTQRWALVLLSCSLWPVGAALAAALCTRSYKDMSRAGKAAGVTFVALLVAMLVDWTLGGAVASVVDLVLPRSMARGAVTLALGGWGGLMAFPWGHRLFTGTSRSPRAARVLGASVGALGFGLAGGYLRNTPLYHTWILLIIALMASALGSHYVRCSVRVRVSRDRVGRVCFLGLVITLLLCWWTLDVRPIRSWWPARPPPRRAASPRAVPAPPHPSGGRTPSRSGPFESPAVVPRTRNVPAPSAPRWEGTWTGTLLQGNISYGCQLTLYRRSSTMVTGTAYVHSGRTPTSVVRMTFTGVAEDSFLRFDLQATAAREGNLDIQQGILRLQPGSPDQLIGRGSWGQMYLVRGTSRSMPVPTSPRRPPSRPGSEDSRGPVRFPR